MIYTDRAHIINFRKDLDDLRTNKKIERGSLSKLTKNLDVIETEFQNREVQIGNLTNNINTIKSEKIIVDIEKKVMLDKINELINEKSKLENDIRILQKQRAQIPSKSLVTTFRQSLDSMAASLHTPDTKGNYTISSMNVKLKTNLSLQNNELQFQLPKPDDILLPENLSTIEFTIKSSSDELDFSKYMEVPDFIGITREDTESAINNAGFKLGTVSEKESNSYQGTVISQMPSAGSIAASGDLIDITISKIMYVEMPNIMDFDIDSAKEILASSNLNIGDITAKQSASTSGIVIDQSIESGTHTLIGTSIDIVVAENVKHYDWNTLVCRWLDRKYKDERVDLKQYRR